MRKAQRDDLFVLLTPAASVTSADLTWQQQWQATYGGHCTDPLHVSLQRFVCPPAAPLHALIEALQRATAKFAPLSLVGVDLRPLYSAYRDNYVLKCRVQRSAVLEALNSTVRQTILAHQIRPHYNRLAVLVTVLEDIGSPASLAPHPLPVPLSLCTAARLLVSRVTGQEEYEHIASWDL